MNRIDKPKQSTTKQITKTTKRQITGIRVLEAIEIQIIQTQKSFILDKITIS